MNAIPARYFAIPPYKAVKYLSEWSGVENANGVNCLTFTDKPGAVMTTHQNATNIAKTWNNNKA